MGLFTWLGLASGDAGSFAEGMLLDRALEKPAPSFDPDIEIERMPATVERMCPPPATSATAPTSTRPNVQPQTPKVHYRKSLHGGFDTM